MYKRNYPIRMNVMEEIFEITSYIEILANYYYCKLYSKYTHRWMTLISKSTQFIGMFYSDVCEISVLWMYFIELLMLLLIHVNIILVWVWRCGICEQSVKVVEYDICPSTWSSPYWLDVVWVTYLDGMDMCKLSANWVHDFKSVFKHYWQRKWCHV